MRLTLFTDYALRLMVQLACEPPGSRTTIEQAARLLNLPVNHLTKIAHRLAKAKLITTSQGRNGGLVLSRPTSEISIGEVLRVTEPDFASATCMAGKDCSFQIGCGLKHLLDAALAAFFGVVDQTTLAELTQQPAGHFGSPTVAGCEPPGSSQGSRLKHHSGER
jgi:Rrf2 family nitric oxide-sensitive transcriptional repressor